MTEHKQLLTDEQMQEFIVNGFLILKTDFSEEFHEKLLTQLNGVYQGEGNPGNNLLPRVRELQQVFDHPVIDGALTSVLGDNYLMHAHRHGHFNNSPDHGAWHKDSYWGYQTVRHHRPWWAMIMYFPQDTPIELGPTGVMPGTQNHATRIFKEDNLPEEAKAFGAAGTFALIHYDIWHRATANQLGRERYMLKFEFMRTEAPVKPTWDLKDPQWHTPNTAGIFHEHQVMWQDTWSWLKGESLTLTGSVDEEQALKDMESDDVNVRTKACDALGFLGDGASDKAVAALREAMTASYEPISLNAAYSLARLGEKGQKALFDVFTNERIKAARSAAYGLQSCDERVIDGLIEALSHDKKEVVAYAAFALGEQREKASKAVGKLIEQLSHPEPLVRHTVVDALGIIQSPEAEVTEALIKALKDENVQVRFTAGLAFIKMGTKSKEAVPHLIEALEDEDRYVRAHSLEALYYIGTPEAYKAVFHQLRNARWCTSTSPASTF
ncbi:phytanoyl-CoA dioxygenase [Bacillaceae bacterium SIJ1]|uniref:HEAT repeat domain-containing protein n=1 Tax=Litoribacterium kuwaitense TaxID=1398745 RepID=UPI0013EBCA64|nr:HEAT repeat domain-containing protein [Litoribacterium kuwaitense]NGP46730.1 phytanoyl-CoA dioxygenase [Litoribacterium kuwaitense]